MKELTLSLACLLEAVTPIQNAEALMEYLRVNTVAEPDKVAWGKRLHAFKLLYVMGEIEDIREVLAFVWNTLDRMRQLYKAGEFDIDPSAQLFATFRAVRVPNGRETFQGYEDGFVMVCDIRVGTSPLVVV